jgi:soluble P-type ATPase
MIEVQIPGKGRLVLKYLVMDYNGTLSVDGQLIAGVDDWIRGLAGQIEIHVITADTFGKVRQQMAHLPCTITIAEKENQAAQKQDYIENLGAEFTAAIGNGRNDRLMLQTAALGVATLQREGCASETCMAADIVVGQIQHAFELLQNPKRLIATLRD